jgi:hypothetical protein
MNRQIDDFLEEHDNAMLSINVRLRETQQMLARIQQEDSDYFSQTLSSY